MVVDCRAGTTRSADERPFNRPETQRCRPGDGDLESASSGCRSGLRDNWAVATS